MYTLNILLTILTLLGAVAQQNTLVLTMLVREESQNLERTLPVWAGFVDYWVIGLEIGNKDDSRDVIMKHLGHIPGAIIEVQFQGMGPTWTQLLQYSREQYPLATHGIAADADFLPLNEDFNKSQLDLNCPKQLYTVLSTDRIDQRKVDWIYRNVDGVELKRRIHQTLHVPELATSQPCMNPEVNLVMHEVGGGYQERTGSKAVNYAMWLEQDLIDDPDDPRTIFYLANAYIDVYFSSGVATENFKADILQKAKSLFYKRTQIGEDTEEKFHSYLKLGQIYDDLLDRWDIAEKLYKKCIKLDNAFAEPWFYLGQHYRRVDHDFVKATKYLRKAASMPIPERTQMIWTHLYRCLAPLEYARAAFFVPCAPRELLVHARDSLGETYCSTKEIEKVEMLWKDLHDRVKRLESLDLEIDDRFSEDGSCVSEL